jgi:hypothetical protein
MAVHELERSIYRFIVVGRLNDLKSPPQSR